MKDINVGIVTDTHSNGYDTKIVEALKKHNLEAITYLGDTPSNMNAHPQEHFNEIAKALQNFDEIGVPIFWIPGNYEDFQAYKVAFQELDDKLNWVYDCSENNSVEFEGHNFVFVPGAKKYTRGFHVNNQIKTGNYKTQEGILIYNFNPNDLKQIVQNPDKTIVFAHNPCKIEGDNSIDLAVHANYPGEPQPVVGPYAHQLIKSKQATPIKSHEGNEDLTKILKEIGIQKFFSGDIHEAASIVDINGNPIKEGQYSKQLFANPGPAKEGDYGIVNLKNDGTASMTRYNITGNKRNYLSELLN